MFDLRSYLVVLALPLAVVSCTHEGAAMLPPTSVGIEAGVQPPLAADAAGAQAPSPVADAAMGTQADTNASATREDSAGGGDASPVGRLAAQATGSGLPGPPNACHGLKGENKLTPATNVRYCVGAHPDCKTPGAGCPLYITFNSTGAYFKRLQDPDKWGKFITVESRQEYGGADVGDPFAELPRVIARDYPGLDENRIYAMGNSRGAAAILRSMCRKAYRYDQSKYGSVSDVYAAVAATAFCPVCDDGFVPKMGNVHFMSFDGENDTDFAKDKCVPELQKLAASYKCSDAKGTWCNVPADDGLPTRGDGSDKIRKFTVGTCQNGGLVGYILKDEGHISTATKHFQPPLNSYDLAWEFFQDKRKVGGGANVGKLCAP